MVRIRRSLNCLSNERSVVSKIGRISRTERFWASVSFDYHNGDLFWNRGLGFLGNRNGNFVLRLSVVDGEKDM